MVVFGISFGFPKLFQSEGQIAHVLLTRSPLVYSRRSLTARLACVKHAASVRPEPGSNSPLKSHRRSPDTRTGGHRRNYGVSRQELSSPGTARSRCLTKGTVRQVMQKQLLQHPVDGALNNSSSTFGTLLSSQGSRTHLHHASRLRLGGNSTNLPVRQGPVKSLGQSRHPCPRAPSRAL